MLANALVYLRNDVCRGPTRPDAPSLGIPPPLPISVPTSSPPLLLPSASRREDRPEVTLPPRRGQTMAIMDREIRRDPEREVRYGITDSWDEIVETLQGAPVSTDTELGRHMTAFETRTMIKVQRQLLAGRLNMLFRDRRAHAYTPSPPFRWETEAKCPRAWRRLIDAIDPCPRRELFSTERGDSTTGTCDHLAGASDSPIGIVVVYYRDRFYSIQRQQGPAKGPAQPELPEEAGSSS
ncbi:hypothetical protein Tco_1275612 [Tanacetum coccineum]